MSEPSNTRPRSPRPRFTTAGTAAGTPLGVMLAGLGLVALGFASRPAPQETQAPIAAPAGVTGDSNGRMIAVTGVDVTGQSVLYLVDTIDKQLAVYQASGGSGNTRGVQLIGARKIDLDLKLNGFNDKTQDGARPLKRADLEEMFHQEGLLEDE